jgi:hypothetical protein
MATEAKLRYDARVVDGDMLFEVRTHLGFTVSAKARYWQMIVTTKHPAMAGREGAVRESLESPDEIRRSRRDPKVYLFYRQERPGRWICAVVKRTDGEAFLVTTYPTDAIKEGERIWRS